MIDYAAIGKRIQKKRQERSITQEKLAEAAELSVPYVSHIERGNKKASISTFIRLASALGITVDTLLLGWQPAEAAAIDPDVKALLEDCSPRERQVILKIAAATKQILRDAA